MFISLNVVYSSSRCAYDHSHDPLGYSWRSSIDLYFKRNLWCGWSGMYHIDNRQYDLIGKKVEEFDIRDEVQRSLDFHHSPKCCSMLSHFKV